MGGDYIEFVNAAGETLRAERYERFVPVNKIEHSPRFQEYCKTCPNYSKNLACPPSTPDFISYVGETGAARVICFRIPLTSQSKTNRELQRADIRQGGKFLLAELTAAQKQGHRVAGAGGCRACETCAGEKGISICRKPGERIFSLEAMGVDVGALLKQAFGFGLEWQSNGQKTTFINTVGAVFYDDCQNN